MRWNLTSTVTPTPLLYSFFSLSPQSKIDRTIVILTFFKIKFQNYFWALSRGPRGFCPSFSIPLLPLHIKFFLTFLPQFFIAVYPGLSEALPDWTKPASLYSFFSFSSESMSDRTEVHTTTPNHRYTHFFQNKIFKIIFGPFPGAPGSFAPHFRIPLLPLHILKFFLTFLPKFFILFSPGLFQALPDWTKPASLYSFFSISPKSL